MSRPNDTRNHILLTAQHLFAHSGYAATGVAEICQAAGVSKGAFYYHFPSKQDVFLELLNRWLAGIETAMQTISQQDQPIPQIFLNLTDMLPSVVQSADGQLPMFLEYWQQASRDPLIWQAMIDPYRRFRQFFTLLVQRGVEAGDFRPLEAEAAGQVILSLAVGLLLQSLLDPQGADWPALARQSVGLVIRGWERT